MAPFEDALEATNSSGKPDHRTRLSAAGAVLDRVYGKANSCEPAKSKPVLNYYGEPIEEALDAEINRLLASSSWQTERARAFVDLGEALRKEGRRADARAPLREAIRLARQGGAVRIATHAHRELQATGEKVRRYTPIGAESLTPTERRVADLAATGMTNREIAQSLFVTLKTVEAHLTAAYDKLDIVGRRQIANALGGAAND